MKRGSRSRISARLRSALRSIPFSTFWPMSRVWTIVSGAAAVATAHFENTFSAQIHLRCDVVVELDGRAVRLVFRSERQGDRRLAVECVIQEEHLIAAEAAREERIPHPPDGLADASDVE